MAPNGRSNLHVDAYQSDVHQGPGPLGREMQRRSTFLEGVCASVTLRLARADRDGVRRGRGAESCCCSSRARSRRWPRCRCRCGYRAPAACSPTSPGGGYFLILDDRDRAVIPTTTPPPLRGPADRRRDRLRDRARLRPLDRRAARRQDHLGAAGLARAAVVRRRHQRRRGDRRPPPAEAAALGARWGRRLPTRSRSRTPAPSTSSPTRRCTGSKAGRGRIPAPVWRQAYENSGAASRGRRARAQARRRR